jgi:hypothetical protein
MNDDPLLAWKTLVAALNSNPGPFGAPGVRDPEYPCAEFDGKNYDGTGDCLSDGHYLCNECSRLSPNAPRFVEQDRGRADRLLLFWDRRR